jgi:hypothetical protein
LTINVSRRTIGPDRLSLKYLQFEFGMSAEDAEVLDLLFGYNPKNHYSGWQAVIDLGKGYTKNIPGKLFLVKRRGTKEATHE